MKTYGLSNVELTGGYLHEKQELNRNVTMKAVYDFFKESGRIGAFKCDYKDGDPIEPHFYWDSDVAKWMEGAAYVLEKHPDPELEAKVDALVDDIAAGQGEDGYFNIYFTVVKPEDRFTDRDRHELYCAGHLMEAAVAYAASTGKTKFLDCMEKYADYIYQVFVVDKSAKFFSPGHEEIELALVKMFRFTGKRKYLDLAAHFINIRGAVEDQMNDKQVQSHLPVREQTEAVGHSVRAVYLYTGMAYVAKETGDETLLAACKTLYNDIVKRKMYVTGGLGSTYIGEAFSVPYDLPNDHAYTETCAGIGMIFFMNGMLAMENRAEYADVIERELYNGVLSGLSADGKRFFYENPLEINMTEHYKAFDGKVRRFPRALRPASFGCSCCPPNTNRLLASLNSYLYGVDGDTLYVNQFAESTLTDGDITCTVNTDYPRGNTVTVKASGIPEIAVRIPGWCGSFTLNKPYTMQNGYAVIKNDGEPVTLTLDMTPAVVYADPRVLRDAGKVCVRRGPVIYCAETVDNDDNLHGYAIPHGFDCSITDGAFGLPELDVSCFRLLPFEDTLYSSEPPVAEPATLHMIPYNSFANRSEEETSMVVWFPAR